MDLRTALAQGQRLLEDGGIGVPRLTAEVLLAHAIGCERAWLYAHSDEELKDLWWIHYGRGLHERLGGKPTQYITGHQEFFGRDFIVSPAVLIPRPETELVVEAAIERLGDGAALDIGTGSGAIAVTLALETRARVAASDISALAIGVASQNARKLSADVRNAVCDLGVAFADASFDLVVSNPPYVPQSDTSTIQREVREHEPAVALYGGEDGFAIYQRLIPEAARLLRADGWLVMEINFAGGDQVKALLQGWEDVEIQCDLAGLPRVITARKRTS